MKNKQCEVARGLGDVAVRVLLSLHALQVLLFDENVDALFDDLNFRLEAGRELVEDFSHQLRVIQGFAHLHDANDGSLNEHLAVFFDVLVRHLLLSLLFRLQREVDVDAEFLAKNCKKKFNSRSIGSAQRNSLLERGVESDLGVGQQLVLIHVALQQAHLEQNAENLLQVLLTDSCGEILSFFAKARSVGRRTCIVHELLERPLHLLVVLQQHSHLEGVCLGKKKSFENFRSRYNLITNFTCRMYALRKQFVFISPLHMLYSQFSLRPECSFA